MKEKLKFLFQDKTVYPVFAMCGLFHLFIIGIALWLTGIYLTLN